MSLTLSGLWPGLCFRLLIFVPLSEIKFFPISDGNVVFFLLQQYPYDIPTEAFPFDIFKQAFVAVQSCVVHLQVCLPNWSVGTA